MRGAHRMMLDRAGSGSNNVAAPAPVPATESPRAGPLGQACTCSAVHVRDAARCHGRRTHPQRRAAAAAPSGPRPLPPVPFQKKRGGGDGDPTERECGVCVRVSVRDDLLLLCFGFSCTPPALPRH